MIDFFQYTLLLTLFIPLLSLAIIPKIKANHRTRALSILSTGLNLAISIAVFACFTSTPPSDGTITYTYQIYDGIVLSLLLDRLNATLLPLISLVYFLVLYSSTNVHHKRIYPQSILISQFLTLATILSPSSFQLLLFLVLQPILPLVEIKKRKTGEKAFAFYMYLSSILILLGYLISFFLDGYKNHIYFEGALLSVGLLIRIGIFPLHSWLHDMISKASFSTAILFLIPLCPVYAFIRMILPIAPAWALQGIAVLSLLTSLYAAGLNFVKKDMRHFFSNLFLCNSSLILAGLELNTEISITGSLCIWISMLLSLTGFAIALQAIEARVGRLKLDRYHGLYEQMPEVAGFFLITGLASIGFPLTVGFIAIELLIEGAVEVYPFVGTTIIVTTALNGIAILYSYFQLFAGRKVESSVVLLVKQKERIAIALLTLLIIIGGFYPQPGVALQYLTSKQIIETRKNLPNEPILDSVNNELPHTNQHSN